MKRGKSCAMKQAVRASVAGVVVEMLESRRLLAAAAGPDGYGYVADAHAFDATAHLTENAAGVVSIISSTDDESAPIDIGRNPFTFYGHRYGGADQVYASSNGIVSFGKPDSNYSNTDLTGYPQPPSIAALWD